MPRQSQRDAPQLKHTCSQCGETISRQRGFTKDYCEDCKIKRAKQSESIEIASEEELDQQNNGFMKALKSKLPF